MNKAMFVLLLFLFTATACNNTGSEDEKVTDATIINAAVKTRIDSTLKSFIDSGKTAAVSALVFENGKEVYYGAFGYADREAKTPMDRNTIVRIFSMTKPVTGVALMTLYDKGAFQLDDPLSKY